MRCSEDSTSTSPRGGADPMYPTPGASVSPERTLGDTAATTAGANRKERPGAVADRCFGIGRAVNVERSVPPCWCVTPRARESRPEVHTLTGPITGRREGSHRLQSAGDSGRRRGRRFGDGTDDGSDGGPAVMRRPSESPPPVRGSHTSGCVPAMQRGLATILRASACDGRPSAVRFPRRASRAVGSWGSEWGSPGEHRVARGGNAARPRRIPERIKAPESIRSRRIGERQGGRQPR